QLCALEKGRRQPSLRTLKRVCEALGAEPSDVLRAASAAAGAPPPPESPAGSFLPGMEDLFQTPEERLFSPLAHRGMVRTVLPDPYAAPPPDDESVRAIESRLADYLRLETICGAFAGASIPLTIPFQQDASGAEELAGRVRAHLGLGDSIVLDYVSVLENHGIRVVFLPLPPGVGSLGFHDARNGGAAFAVSDSTTTEKQLFRIATELAWLYLFVRNGNKPVPESAEANRRFAKYFAACFLLPSAAVRTVAASLGARRGDWTYPLVLRVKRHFGVSAEAFAYRLLELGLSDETRTAALVEKTRAHYATHQNREPGLPAPALVRDGRLADMLERARSVPGAYDEIRGIARRAGIAFD
ncbi:MAG: ImmA/IrrE family metallo-endopeptidase, partial [Kiritimatiellae bacterium]|nr:ImmA/IrrE family metallo-endopeptidase [Kiritimatiellia bacterium]